MTSSDSSRRDRYAVDAVTDAQVAVTLSIGDQLEVADDGTVYNSHGSALCRLVPITRHGTRLVTLAADVPRTPDV